MRCCLCFTARVPIRDCQEALTALLWAEVLNLSVVISFLTASWQEDYDRWQRRNRSACRYCYFSADGIHLHALIEPTSADASPIASIPC